MKHSFFLVIPKQQQNPQRLKEFEEKILQQWISELPVGNPSLATRLVYDLIIEFNGLEMPSQLRLDTLELLRPSFFAIDEYLKAKILNSDFPKDTNDQKALKLLVSVQRQFTIGYWILVKELTEQETRWFKSKNAAISIQRCIKGLSNIIASYFMMGMRVPDWVWMDVHSLYRLSVKTKKNAIQVVNWDNHSVKKTSSTEECYLQILMLSLADYTGLMPKEIGLVYKFSETILPLVSIRTRPAANQTQQCIVLTEEDKPPFFHDRAGKAGSNLDINDTDVAVLYIDFTNLLHHKEMAVNVAQTRFSTWNQSDDTKETISLELFEYLQQRWLLGTGAKSELLFSDRLDRYIAIGLTASFKLVKSQEGQLSEDQEFLSHSVSNELLSGIFKKKGVLSIGSLISFRKIDAPQHKRALAVVNKLVAEKEAGRISFGVQLLTHQFLPVSYHRLDPNASENLKNALIYKQEVENENKNYIIMDTYIFKEGDIIQLLLNQDQFPIVLKNKRNIALGYWQFECMRISKKDVNHS